MFGRKKIGIDKALYDRALGFAKKAGYSSVDELVVHLIEKELSQIEGLKDENEIKKKLQGLGYLG